MSGRTFMAGLGAAAVAALTTAALTTAAGADERTEPLWEIGVGAFGLSAPDYPASAERSVNGLALPYGIYRGEILRIDDEDGARVVPVETPRVQVSVSAGAAFGARSEGRGVREGMPDLDPLLELGPELVFRGPGFGPTSRRGRLDLALQARVVGSLDIDNAAIDYRGLVFEPALEARWPDVLGRDSALRASLGPIFATAALHEFFYSVEAPFARPGRAEYDARGGYLGTDLVVSLSRDLTDRFTAFGGGVVSNHTGAANADSPLYERETTGSAFFGVAVILGQSARHIPVRY